MDLDKANKEDKPTWELTVDYVRDYSLDSISPDDMAKLATKIKTDGSFAGLYQWHMSRKVGTPKELSDKDAEKLGCMVGSSEE